MRKVTYGDSIFLLQVREEWSLVVDFEVEDSVLIWKTDFGAVGCGVRGTGGWGEGNTVEGRKHRNLELEEIVGWDREG